MSKTIKFSNVIVPALVLPIYACTPGGVVTQGTQPTAVVGSAAGGTSAGADDSLIHCQRTLGTIAINDGQESNWYGDFGRATQIATIEPLLRLAVQQSNCFVITSVGNQNLDTHLSKITNIQRNSGEYRAGSKQHKGQRVAADYYLEPQIIIRDSSVGKLGGKLLNLLGNNAIGDISGDMESKASVVTLSLFDIRSAVQIAAAEGSSTATNYGVALSAFGIGGGDALSGFSTTPEGKATVAAFIDAWNKMVIALRNYKAQEVEGGLGTGGVLKVN